MRVEYVVGYDDLVIRYLVPSRGRPTNVRRLWQAWQDTEAVAELIIIVDEDDPKLSEYEEDHARYGVDYTLIEIPPMGCIGRILNEFAPRLAQHGMTDDVPADAVGFMGDDHLPRTIGWDRLLLSSLRTSTHRPAIAYPRDGGIGDQLRLPTSVLLDADVITKLGWMVPPGLQHMYLDNFWRDLGNELGALVFVTDALVEHMHPAVGKSGWDDRYQAVNSDKIYDGDEHRYQEFVSGGGIQRCVETIRG